MLSDPALPLSFYLSMSLHFYPCSCATTISTECLAKAQLTLLLPENGAFGVTLYVMFLVRADLTNDATICSYCFKQLFRINDDVRLSYFGFDRERSHCRALLFHQNPSLAFIGNRICLINDRDVSDSMMQRHQNWVHAR